MQCQMMHKTAKNMYCEFQVCPSYAGAVMVPASVPDDVIRYSAVFRHGGRFPVLSYRHSNGVSM